MPSFSISRKSDVTDSFRVAKIRSMFDLQDDKICEHFNGTITIPEEWEIGLIVGPSGSGKSTIA